MIRRRIRSNVVDLGNSQVLAGTNQNETRLRGIANRRKLDRVAGDATMQNRLQRSTTQIYPAFNIVNQSRRSSNLVQRGQFRDASFRQQALSRFDRLNRQAVEDERYQENRDYRIGRDEVSDQRYEDNRNYRIGRDKVADERYNEGQSRLKRLDAQNAKQTEFNNRLTQRNEERRDELHDLNVETARIKNQAVKSQLNAKKIPKFQDTFKDGALIRQARESGVDVSGFYDESGNLTRQGEEYLDSVETAYNTNGGDISSALKSGGSGTLLAGQNNISARIKELERAKAVGEFSDGTNFSGEHELELEDAKSSISQNASRLYRLNPNARNPERDRQIKVLQTGISGALDVADNIKGDDPVSMARRGIEVQEFLNEKGIDLNQISGDSEQAKRLRDLISQADPKLVALQDEVDKRKNNMRRDNGLTQMLSTPTSVAGGLAYSQALQGYTQNDVDQAERKLQEYLKKKGGK